jgi:uncharacterized protein
MLRRRLALAAVPLLVAVGLAAPSDAARLPRVLVYDQTLYDQTLGFHHQSIEKAEKVLPALAKGRFTYQVTQDPKALNAATLARTDVVVWLSNTAASGRVSPFTDAQEKAYARWMLCGGGHVGVHAAVDSYDDKAFPAYVEANGAIFTAHPITVTSAADDTVDNEHEGWGEPEHRVLVTDQRTPMTAPWRGKSEFLLKEELYQLDRDPGKKTPDYRLLLAHGGVTDPQATVTGAVYPGPYDERQPLAWSGSYRGKNRTFYTNLGHSVIAWDDKAFRTHLVNGIVWTAGHRTDAGCLARAGIR